MRIFKYVIPIKILVGILVRKEAGCLLPGKKFLERLREFNETFCDMTLIFFTRQVDLRHINKSKMIAGDT